MLLIFLVASSIEKPASVKIFAREDFLSASSVSFPAFASSRSFPLASSALLSASLSPDLPMESHVCWKVEGVAELLLYASIASLREVVVSRSFLNLFISSSVLMLFSFIASTTSALSYPFEFFM